LVAGLVANVASGGRYGLLLRSHISFLRWYALSGTQWAKTRNSWRAAKEHYRSEGILGILRYLLVTNGLSVAAMDNCLLLGVLVLSANGYGDWRASSFPEAWMLAGAMMWLATSLPPLLFLGEAERYLVNAAIPSYVIIATWLNSVPNHWRWAMLIYSIVWWAGQQVILWKVSEWKKRQKEQTAALRELDRFLEQLPNDMVITLGSSPFSWELAYRSKHRHWQIEGPALPWTSLFSQYPYPMWSAVPLVGAGLAVADKRALSEAIRGGELRDWPFSELVPCFENDYYVIFRVGSGDGGTTAA
jgi:hypothetical protein